LRDLTADVYHDYGSSWVLFALQIQRLEITREEDLLLSGRVQPIRQRSSRLHLPHHLQQPSVLQPAAGRRSQLASISRNWYYFFLLISGADIRCAISVSVCNKPQMEIKRLILEELYSERALRQLPQTL
jgi:hypothetical protein